MNEMQNKHKSDWNEDKKEIAKRLRTAYAYRAACNKREIDGDLILDMLGCIPMNVCLGYDVERPFYYSTEELSYLAELIDPDTKEEA